jgi:DNA-binding PucR family transcriptional regulator
MAWLPWATLPARSSMTTRELVDWLRAHAIEFGAPPQFIDAIDSINEAYDQEEEMEELREELDAAENDSSALADALNAMLKEINEDDATPNVWKAAEKARGLLRKMNL